MAVSEDGYGEMYHVVGDNNGQAITENRSVYLDNDIDAHNNVAIAGVDTIAGFDLDLTKYIESELAFFLRITESEDTGTRNERKDPYGMSGHVV